MGEEVCGVKMLCPTSADHDLREIRREVGFGNRAPEDAAARTRGLEYHRNRHARSAFLCPLRRRTDRPFCGGEN